MSKRTLIDMRKLGVTNTSELTFKTNEFNIKVYPFNKFETPELLEAKELHLEMAFHSRVEFKMEVV